MTDWKKYVEELDLIATTASEESNFDELLNNCSYENPNTPSSNTPPSNTCRGCIEDQPNQEAHMDFGGCLYRSYDNEPYDNE